MDPATGVNDGLVRCPRCAARLLSECASLERRPAGADRVLWMPLVPTPEEKEAAAAKTAKMTETAETAEVTEVTELADAVGAAEVAEALAR